MKYYDSASILYHNGKFEKSEDARGDLFSQSLHYGLGAFEGIRAYNTHNGTRLYKAGEHFIRLRNSCQQVGIPYPWDNYELIHRTYELLQKNGLKDAYVRPLVYCEPNMALEEPQNSSIMICAWEWPAYLGNNLLKVCISEYERPNPKSVNIEAKITGHYVNSILAAADAKRRGYDEALQLDLHGYVAESPGANFFLERNGKLYTPKKGNILPGITRATVFGLSKYLGIDVEEKDLTVQDVKKGDSAFLCGTAIEIMGIKSIEEKEFTDDWQDTLGAAIQRMYKNRVLEKENYEVII